MNKIGESIIRIAKEALALAKSEANQRDEEPEMESPEWHGDILAERKKMIDQGKAEFISLEELKANRKL